ncbi:MAG: 3',5'-cyclic-nucleotide phosphodiesterase [Methylophilaceae bacterium]|nr:3',5'-cyclic-nucleotide phosphodiesterase [Methylophilaceae bacterium]
MKIRILGCSGGACNDLRTTALLVDGDTLVDCGTGVGDLTLEEMAAVRHVFLTHSHLDHVLFLPLLSDAALASRNGPLTVHALQDTLSALSAHVFNGVLWPDYTRLPSPDQPYIRFAPVSLGQPVPLEGFRITPLPALHTVPAVGYLISNECAGFAFSGDTTYCEAFWDTLNGVENLRYVMVETTMRDADHAVAERSRHTTPRLLAQGMARLQRPARLLVTHIEPDKVEQVRAEVRAALGNTPVHFLTRGEVFEL